MFIMKWITTTSSKARAVFFFYIYIILTAYLNAQNDKNNVGNGIRHIFQNHDGIRHKILVGRINPIIKHL